MTGSVGDILERPCVSVKWEVGNGASARQSKHLCTGHVQRPCADRKAGAQKGQRSQSGASKVCPQER